jgi:hypothetical protein
MSLKFHANTYSAYTEDDVQILGFADDGQQPEHYLLLQRAECFDEQDRQLGMDTYYVELGGQGVAGYGGIEQLQLAPGRLTLRFSSTLDWCRGLPSLDISWDAGLASVEEVRAALGEMLLGTDTHIQLQPGPGAPQ